MKVLIVEDDAVQRMHLAHLLGRFDKVEIIEAADADSAWQALEAGLIPVLCCCDMRMPGMSGMEFLRRFRSRPGLADTPFIFITVSAERNTIEEAIAFGVTSYILKPFNFAKARSGLEKIFRGIRARYAEQPVITQRRLRVTPKQLLSYFVVFTEQLAKAHATVLEQLAGGEASHVPATLDSLKAGCVTLGLWHAATMITSVQPLESDMLERMFTDVKAIIVRQTSLI